MYKFVPENDKQSGVVISNTENEPFLLPIDISQYGDFEADELEIRVCNDFIEVSGQQEWRMATGGANKRMFAQRHVLPKHIDLKAIYCRLLDGKTVLISAPSVSFVSKLISSDQLKVDYIVGLDCKGLQYLKRYNSTTPTKNTMAHKYSFNQNSINKDRYSNDDIRFETNSSISNREMSNILFDMVKNPTKNNTNGNSKLFNTEMGQRNINFVNSLKSKGLKVTTLAEFENEKLAGHKIRLNIDQLMKKEKHRKKDADKKKQQEDSIAQSDGNKSKRKRMRTRRNKLRSQLADSTVNDERVNDDNHKKVQTKKRETKTTEIPVESNKNKNLNDSTSPKNSSSDKKCELNSKEQQERTSDLVDKKSSSDNKESNKSSISNEISLSNDVTQNNAKSEDTNESNEIEDKESSKCVEEAKICSSNKSSSNRIKESSKTNKPSALQGFSSYISTFLTGSNQTTKDSSSSSAGSSPVELNFSPSTSTNAPVKLISCLKENRDHDVPKKNKHVLIAELDHVSDDEIQKASTDSK